MPTDTVFGAKVAGKRMQPPNSSPALIKALSRATRSIMTNSNPCYRCNQRESRGLDWLTG
jgi:hypothetical protein